MRVGIVLNNLGVNQQAFMAISYANTLIKNNIINDISLFYCDNSPFVIKSVAAAFNVDKAYQFDGLLITNDIYTASLIHSTNARKILYLWDLEWLRGKGSYISNLNILKNKDYTIMCRSPYHAKVIENYCGVKPIIVPNFNIPMMLEKLNGK